MLYLFTHRDLTVCVCIGGFVHVSVELLTAQQPFFALPEAFMIKLN